MNTINRFVSLVIFIAVLFVLSPSNIYATKTDFSLRADPTFSEASLPSDMRIWYTRMWGGINKGKSMYPDAVGAVTSGNVYLIGRTWQAHLLSMLAAFRATGDIKILDNIDSLMQQARAQLRDVWTPQCSEYPYPGKDAQYKCNYQRDGFLNYAQLGKNSDYNLNALYYGWDTHPMDEQLAHAALATYTYAIRVNQNIRPAYKEHADFWQGYLINHFEAKWKKRTGKLPIKYLTHPYTTFTSYYYYMYKLTGNSSYITEANSRTSVLKSIIKPVSTSRGIAYTWDHGVPLSSSYPYGCAPTIYSSITLQALSDWAFEGFGPFASDSEMAKFSNTGLALIYKNGTTQLAGNVCGGGSESSYSRASIFPYMATMPWDTSGAYMTIIEKIYLSQQGTGDPRSPLIPAYMVASIAKKRGLRPGTTIPAPTSNTAPKPGDGNNDNVVDGFDYLIYLNNFGRTNVAGGASEGDFNKDRSVNTLDYSVWKVNFN